MSNIYTIKDQTLTGIADAVRELRHESGKMTPAQIEEKIRASKQGLPIHLEEKFLHTNIDPVTKKWVRPSEYPDLDSIYIAENEEVVYLTYDLRKTPGYGWIGVYVANTTNDTNFYIERGHLTNIVVEVENNQGDIIQQTRVIFVADYTVTRQSTSATTATSPRYFRQDLDQANGQIQLWRVRSDNTIANFKFVARSATKTQNFNYRMQPCVERVGQLGYITNLSSTSSGTDFAITATSHSWCTAWLQRDKMILTGKANNTTLSYSYFDAYSLQQCDFSHWDTSKWAVTTLAGTFASCWSVDKIDLHYWDTSNWAVTTMTEMFRYDRMLRQIDMSGWDTTKFAVTVMRYAFEGVTSLTVCKISNFKYTGTATNLGTGFPNVVTLKQWDGYEVALAHSYSDSISLTPTSLVNIFNRLSTVTGSPKITIGQTNKLKLTAEQLAIATNKGWAIA